MLNDKAISRNTVQMDMCERCGGERVSHMEMKKGTEERCAECGVGRADTEAVLYSVRCPDCGMGVVAHSRHEARMFWLILQAHETDEEYFVDMSDEKLNKLAQKSIEEAG